MSDRNHYTQCLEYSMSLTGEVSQISSPMLEQLGVLGFSKLRLHKDGRRRFLSTSPEWTEYFYEENLFDISSYSSYVQLKEYNLWAHWPKSDPYLEPFLQNAKERFDYGNGLVIVKNYGDYVDSYTFRAAFDDSDANNRYMNEFENMDRFINYFNIVDKQSWSKKFDGTLKANNIRESIHKQAEEVSNSNKLFKKVDFFQATEFYYEADGAPKFLSSRESDCVKALMIFPSIKEVALHLGISPRTVESHLTAVKLKLGCMSKNQILKTILQFDYNRNIILSRV